jgi:hypothetical protein
VFEQEDAAVTSAGVAGNPEPVFVLADEKQGDRLTENAGIGSLR